MLKTFGRKVHELRVRRGYTQADLARLCNGAITQGQISKIERGVVFRMQAESLISLCKALGTDLSYYMHTFNENYHYEQHFYDLVNEQKAIYNYKGIDDIIRDERMIKQNTNHTEFKQYVNWNTGIIDYYVYNDPEKAIYTFDEAIKMTNLNKKYFSERECEILSSKGGVQLDSLQYKSAEKSLKDALDMVNKLPTMNNIPVKSKILLNLSRLYIMQHNFTTASHYCFKGINWCKKNDQLYLLPEFHFNLGECYINLEHYDHAFDSLQNAYINFRIKENIVHLKETEELLKKISKKTLNNPPFIDEF